MSVTGQTYFQRSSRPIRLGFLLIGDGSWRGGVNYQRTLLQTIAGPLAGRIEARVFVTPAQHDLAQEAFGSLLEVPPVVDPRVQSAGTGRRALGTLLTGCDRPLASLVAEHGVEVVFETARFFGRSFPIPALAWIPDFQHRHLPHLFSRADWAKREVGFQAQARGRRMIMLSSATAREDCERFYPSTRGRTHVVRFSPSLDPVAVRARVSQARADHALPERYFYLPNQFWAHKNHTLVLDALMRLRDTGDLEGLPPVIMSGPVSDSRNREMFERLMARAKFEGLLPWFRHLGLIPMEDVLALNSGALAVLNPSLFEGWASSVEEGKGLGSTLLLSDIAVHREQAPKARFFDPADATDLGRALLETARTFVARQNNLTELVRANVTRQKEFAASFEAAILQAKHSAREQPVVVGST